MEIMCDYWLKNLKFDEKKLLVLDVKFVFVIVPWFIDSSKKVITNYIYDGVNMDK